MNKVDHPQKVVDFLRFLIGKSAEDHKEGAGGDSGSEDIADGLRQKDCQNLVLEKTGEEEDQGD